MDSKELKTSTRQRVGIIIVALIMLAAVIAGYAAIVVAGNSKSSDSTSSKISEEKLAQYEEEYEDKLAEFQEGTEDDFAIFSKYMSEVKEFDEDTANSNGVTTKDLVQGTGRELTADDTDHLAYYVGYCADASVFDSSLDDTDSPTAFTKALNASLGMIDGWNSGVVGMKLGGVRRITIPGELAYGDQMEICGGYNKPLRFLVMAVANEDPLATLASEVDTAYLKVQYGYYGIDYAEMSE